MDVDKLRALVELSRLGTMTAVAAVTGFGTSAVSQQLTALQRQVGVPLIEADGRRVRLTPAGRRLAEHGRGILAAITAAEMDVAARTAPHGPVRIAGNTMALQGLLIPAVAELALEYPAVRLELTEGEPPEVLSLLDDDRIDLGFVYDYTLVPRRWRHPGRLLHASPMVIAVPTNAAVPERIATAADLGSLRDQRWIANSRDSADDELTERLCALGGWTPTIAHRADSLDLVVDLVLAGQGVSVLVADAPQAARVRTVPLDLANVHRRMWSVVRAGSGGWPATTAVLDHLVARLGVSGAH
jgi:DNA-binding transcriptional LysR family regulator